MLESIYRHGGYKTGLLTSPHLISLLERIQIDGHLISKENFVQTFQIVHAIAENLKQETPEDVITFFEYMTAIALRYFLEKKVDVAVIEVGLGGRLDATNALKNTSCSVITTVAFDHEETLGHTLPAIAREKAGIIRPHGLVVTGYGIQGEVIETIQDVAQAQGAELHSSQRNHPFDTTTADYQNYNASTAQTAAELLNNKGILPIPNAKILEGIQQFRWPGRWQKIVYQGKTVIFDGAHNEEGAYAVAREIQNLPQPPTLIFGSNTVQRAQKMLAILSPICKKIYFTQSTFYVHPTLHSLDATELYGCCPSSIVPHRVGNIRLENIAQFIETLPEETLVVTGSLYLIGDLMRILVHQCHEILV